MQHEQRLSSAYFGAAPLKMLFPVEIGIDPEQIAAKEICCFCKNIITEKKPWLKCVWKSFFITYGFSEKKTSFLH